MRRVLIAQGTPEHIQLMDFVYRETHKAGVAQFFKRTKSTVVPTSTLESILKKVSQGQDLDGLSFLLMALKKVMQLLKNTEYKSLYAEAIARVLLQINKETFPCFTPYDYVYQLSFLLREMLETKGLSNEVKEIVLFISDQCWLDLVELDDSFEQLVLNYEKTLSKTEKGEASDQEKCAKRSVSPLRTLSLLVSQGPELGLKQIRMADR